MAKVTDMNSTALKLLVRIKNSDDVKIVAVSVLYFLSAQLGLLLSFTESKIIALWPPAGLALALLIIFKHKTWPAITIGSLIAQAMVFLFQGTPFSLSVVMSLVLISIGNTCEALFGYYLISKVIKERNPFFKTAHVFIFLFVAMVMCIIGSGIGTLGMWANQLLEVNQLITHFSSGWLSNVISVLIITPFIISWTGKFKLQIAWARAIEFLIFLGTLGAIVLTLKYSNFSDTIEQSLPFLIMPFLLWLAFRFNLQTTMSGILIVSFIAIFYTINNMGPFSLDTENNSRSMLQIFTGVVSISTLILYATVRERAHAQEEIKAFNERLEHKVQERTEELHEEIRMRKKSEEKIKISNSKLRKANIELDNFVYSVSHDLRAPIASVLGIVNLAQKDDDAAMMKKYLEMIADSAQRQDLFIQEILDLSRNSRLDVGRDEINFDTLITEIFDQLKYSAIDKSIVKEINISQKDSFISDKKRLKVIFNNLISNSIRYCRSIDPIIKIEILIDDATAKISVNDNGKGIAKKHMKKIFDMFYRATDEHAGSGLGLYIVRETIEKLRGNINISSTENEGTTVNLEIPNLTELSH
ncbi:MASE1 domain-containing protein [Fulvivirga maritima]|uniref:sensor histidine kinase n=1 Tax=Fulvivirga maritima TaxID=2904247 RepID=UPI001F1F6540|nr:MASE1 domain-containing protein [Fulvivirga maritima]UII29351.1 MASE1 domain-containing protein [Fulvivirga maritima]